MLTCNIFKTNSAVKKLRPIRSTLILHLQWLKIVIFHLSYNLAISRTDYELALRTAKNLLSRVTEFRVLKDREMITGKSNQLIIANIFHKLGAIYLCLKNPVEALLYFRKGNYSV